MFGKLFGETVEEQLSYLQKRVVLTVVAIVAAIIMAIAEALNLNSLVDIFSAIALIVGVIVFFMWGFGAVKSLLGYGTIGAFFSGNVVIGVIIFVLCLLASLAIGAIIACLGIGRYIYLKVKLAQERKS